MPPALQFLVLTFAGWMNRHQADLIEYLREENRVLREHLGPRPLRLTDAQRRRLAVRGQKLGRRILTQVAGIVTPDTILRWYRRLIAKKYDGSACCGRGRPMTRHEVAALVVRMAVENPQWGYTRIRGALLNLGHEIARTTVKRILHDHGRRPALRVCLSRGQLRDAEHAAWRAQAGAVRQVAGVEEKQHPPALGEEVAHVAETQAEAKVQPDGMAMMSAGNRYRGSSARDCSSHYSDTLDLDLTMPLGGLLKFY